jgi:hypothetical protein
MTTAAPDYLQPYLAAARKYGAGFGSLLWASPQTQAIRFKALLHAVNVTGQSVLDVGCGRGDLFKYMLDTGRYPRCYTGIEAVDALAGEAEKRHSDHCRILRGDFVLDPGLLDVGADVLIYSGSLNTMETPAFFDCLKQGFAAAKKAVAFNFLSSPFLAGSAHLNWHKPEDVLDFCRSLSNDLTLHDRYLRGDATIAIVKDFP